MASYVKGVDKLIASLKQLGPAVAAALKEEADREADQFVDALKSVAPVAPEFERHPGEMRDSIHKEAGRSEISAKVVVDAKDANGRYYAAHVEFGHKFKDGSHAHAKPFFFPVYRLAKPKLKKQMNAAIKKAVRQAFA